MILYKLEFDFLYSIKNQLPYFIIGVGFCLFGIKYRTKQTDNLQLLSVLFLIISAVSLTAFIFSLSDDIISYKKYTDIIDNESFETVTGNVADFHSADVYGKGEESFSVNGVKFSYAQFESVIGYHTVSTKGGIINQNGQALTINYIYDKDYNRNIILQIQTSE